MKGTGSPNQGAVPGEKRKVGRPKGSKGRALIVKENNLAKALRIAFEQLPREVILGMSPATLLKFAMQAAALAGETLAAISFAKEAAPYFDAKLVAVAPTAGIKRDIQEYSDDELRVVAGETFFIEGGSSAGGSEGAPPAGSSEEASSPVH